MSKKRKPSIVDTRPTNFGAYREHLEDAINRVSDPILDGECKDWEDYRSRTGYLKALRDVLYDTELISPKGQQEDILELSEDVEVPTI